MQIQYSWVVYGPSGEHLENSDTASTEVLSSNRAAEALKRQKRRSSIQSVTKRAESSWWSCQDQVPTKHEQIFKYESSRVWELHVET